MDDERIQQPHSTRVDFVLTYDTHGDEALKRNRDEFISNLTIRGLEVREFPNEEKGHINFVLIRVPYDVMCQYAEVLEFRKPFKGGEHEMKKKSKVPASSQFKTQFRASLEDQFVIPEDKESFFKSSERVQVVWYILGRTKFGENKVGITALLNDQTFEDAFPLHDGDYEDDSKDQKCMRARLRENWANLKKWCQEQPLDDIREYFGDEVALYFAWLGLYTNYLKYAAAAGVLCFLYGLVQLATSDRIPLEDVCYGELGEVYMCKRCESDYCGEEKLRSSCGTRWLLLLVDHPVTVLYSIFMSFWATGFLEQWKRKQARLSLKWGGEALLSTGGSDRETWEERPEYAAKARRKREKHSDIEKPFPLWQKVLSIFTAFSVVFFMVAVVIAALIGIIAYKVAISSALYVIENEYVRQNSKNLTAFTAATINLVIIVLLKTLYSRIAIWLTDKENPKTQSDYEASYTFKVFVFEFFNCYSSLFYIAFFKGRFYTYPGDLGMMNSLLATDSCDSGGCLAELFIQLAVILVGKQLLNSFTEILLPRISIWWKSGRHMNGSQVSIESLTGKLNPWEADYRLHPAKPRSLFGEIMEIVLQYGFVTLFVVAFPLAPLCAFIINLFEIRIDADKFVTQYRRPLPRRANSIGPWFAIQQTLTYIAVAVNGFIIAFTTEFIPRLLYTTDISETHDLTGYVNFTLSVFAENSSMASVNNNWSEFKTCRYKGFREPPDSAKPYSLSPIHWQVLTSQLAFVIVFEHFVLGLSGILAYCIPDVPRSVREMAHQEREKARDILRPPRPTSP